MILQKDIQDMYNDLSQINFDNQYFVYKLLWIKNKRLEFP
jgi:hypothetical protein